MKRYLYILCFLLSSNALLGQCPPDTSITMVPPDVECAFNDGSYMNALAIDLDLVEVSGVTDYSFWVTAPPDEDGKERIVNLTATGISDFSDGPDLDGDGNRDPRPPGLYCFTPIGYDQVTVDSITNHVNLQTALAPCANGGETLEEIINCLSENNGGGGIFANLVPTVDNILVIIETIVADAIGYTPCLVRGEPYCVEVRLPGDTTGCNLEVLPEGWVMSIDDPTIDPVSIEVLPNPSNTTATVSFMMNTYELVEISAYDMLGREILKTEIDGTIGKNTYTIDVADWSTGVYFYSISTEATTHTQRMMVDK